MIATTRSPDPATPPASAAVAEAVRSARSVQAGWRDLDLRVRLQVLRRLRVDLAADVETVARVASPLHRTIAEAIGAEVLPTLDAIRFLERSSPALLRDTRLGRRGLPGWLGRLRTVVRREPRGVVLIVAPGNYPLLLTAVQLAQALAAGNAVLVKPAPGHGRVAELLVSRLERAGMPRGLVAALDEHPGSVEAALGAGVDLVIFTGSSKNGRAVVAAAARHLVPVVAELSGCDPVIVLPGADLPRVVEAIAFGLGLNSGHSCIAPRRLIGTRDVIDALLPALRARLASERVADGAFAAATRTAIDEALADGARLWTPARPGDPSPHVLTGVTAGMRVAAEDLAGPLMAVLEARDTDHGIELANSSPCALGASVFGPGADRVAVRLDAGFVAIDDLIVPSADPRVPFGGRRASGFGVTRGAAGLLELTVPKVVSARGRGRLLHLERHRAGDDRLLAALTRFLHPASVFARIRHLGDLASAGRRRNEPDDEARPIGRDE